MSLKIQNIETLQQVYIHPKKVYQNLDENLLQEFRKIMEKKCIDKGYVISVNKIIKKGQPKKQLLNFSGDYNIVALLDIDIYSPEKDEIIKDCKITFINKVGIFAEKDFLRVLIPAQSNNDSGLPANFQDIFKIGDKIDIRVIASQFDLNKDYISIWAYLLPTASPKAEKTEKPKKNKK